MRNILVLTSLAVASVAAAPNGYYRFPALRGETVVFTSEGDLWKVPVAGGTALRLTSHHGMESHAAISPDGTTVAFTAQYEGPSEVYVMPLSGGQPKRLTWHGEGAFVANWTPQGRILYSTKAYSTLPNDQLLSLDPATGDETLLPLAQASDGIFEDSGRQLIFTRLPFQGSSTKRYKGGTAQTLWRYDEGAEEAVPLTADFAGTSKNPLWWQGRVYFLSDRSGISNLWSMKSDGADVQPLTEHKSLDAKSAKIDNGRIVYQHGADLRLFTIATKTDAAIPITLSTDLDQMRERWVKQPLTYLTSAHISPDGNRVVLTARGDVFVAPVEPGLRFVSVPHKDGVRLRNASFFPDGKTLLAQTDETGEIEFARLPANGIGASELLTQDGTVFRFPPVVSPDGKWIAWDDKNRQLWVRNLETKTTKLVETSPYDEFEDLTWSPDSQWLAFATASANTYTQIKLCRAATGEVTTVTSERVNSSSPAFSPDGKWLYFLSERELRTLVPSPWGPRQPEPHFTEVTRAYALALQKGLRSPFEPQDELHPAAPEPKKDDKKPDAQPAAIPAIELDGLAARIIEVPIPAGNYRGLSATGKHLFYTARAVGFDAKPRLMRLDVSNKDPKPKVFAEDVRLWEISANNQRILIRIGDKFHVVPVDGEAPAKLEKSVPLGDWSFSLTPREEWRQVYVESWRMLRDYFYDPKMHGVDWPAVRRKYEPLIERVSDRSELNDVLHEMAGELSALHIFVKGGDLREGGSPVRASSLGALLVKDAAAGGWRIQHIFQSDSDYPGDLSPLLKHGVEAKNGDVIVSINGQSTLGVAHPGQLLRQRAGQQVLLELKSGADGAMRNVIVKPLGTDAVQDLRYAEWEYTRRLEVEKLGEGRIGYVHLRAMGAENIAEWARDFYPVFNRQGLIIDVRHNRGGNIDSWILGKLMRKAWFYFSRRTGAPYWNMQYAFRGHVVVLCNERTASDGEAFSEGFRRLGLGKVIGTRTWGGEIWLSAEKWLVDQGMCTAAEAGVYGPEGTWLIEGHGVDPDITIDNTPRATFLGKDAQLEAAIKHLQELIAKDPRPVPPVPPKPDKSAK
ncbi:MAG: hypothetical protein RL088_1578 [Verrucomicrobiota bacterium]|jgi:tricorn protease